jgi:hypothetical protein
VAPCGDDFGVEYMPPFSGALGATQVGQATAVSTPYIEVREIVPGLRSCSTLQQVSIGIGGSSGDSAAANRWRDVTAR